MTVRALKPSDIPKLQAMQGEFPYPDLTVDAMESVRVVVDENDEPLMAAGAKRLVEMYLWCGNIKRPLARMFALRLLHEDLAIQLGNLGFSSVETSIPPPVAQRFARRLLKSFGWTRNPWPSFQRRF